MLEPKSQLITFIAVIFMICITALIYIPGLNGPFVFDDVHNIEPLGNSGGVDSFKDAERFIFGNESGPTGRPVSMASFLLDDNSWPAASSASFKKTNIALHLVAGLMVFLVAFKVICFLFPSRDTLSLSVAFISMAFWLVHPLNTSTVLYVVQRMAILSTVFSLLAVYLYFCFRTRFVSRDITSYFLLGLSLFFLVLGVFSKENAALVLVFIIGFEIYITKRYLCSSLKYKIIFFILALLSITLILSLTYDIWGSGYKNREFNLQERLISQAVAIGEYLRKIVFPQVSYINLFRGEFENYPKVPFSPLVWANGLFTLLFVVYFGYLSICRKDSSKTALWIGLFWFVSFHLMESTIIPLELYFEHRNYLPSIGILFCAAFLLSISAMSRYMKAFIVVSILIFCSFQTFYLARTWATPDQLFLKWEMDEPKSVRAKVSYAHFLYSKGFPENSVEYIEDAMAYAPDSMMLKFHYLFYSCIPETKVSYNDALDKFKGDNRFDLGVSVMLEQFLENLLDNKFPVCSEGNVDIEKTFEYIENSKNFGNHKNHTVQYYNLKSTFYVRMGNLNKAVTALDKAIDLTPKNHALYIKSADMLASAGLYALAIKRLKRALDVEMTGWDSFNSRSPQIKAKIELFEKLEAGGPSL